MDKIFSRFRRPNLSLGEISKILRHRNLTTTDLYLKSLVTIKTKGIKVLDDIQKVEKAEVISFQDAINKRGKLAPLRGELYCKTMQKYINQCKNDF